MSHTYRIVLIVTLALALSACQSLQNALNIAKPTAAVSKVVISSLSLTGMTLAVDTEVSNPNSFALNTTGFDMKLSVQGNQLAALDQTSQSLSIPANGKATTTVPISLNFGDLYNAIAGLKNKSEFPLQIDAGFNVKLPGLGAVRVPVNYTRLFPIPKLPSIKLQSFKMGDVGFNGAELAVNLEVENPNTFGLNLKQLSYQVNNGDQILGSGQLESVQLGENQAQSVRIPLSINFKDMGMGLYRLFTSGQSIPLSVEGKADINPGTPLWQAQPLDFKFDAPLKR